MKSFSEYHPAVLIVYFISVLITAMFISHPIILFLSLAGSVLFCSFLLKRNEFIKMVSFYLPLLFLILITNPLISHNGITPLFFLNGNPITLEAVMYGLNIALMLVTVLIWFKCYNEVMTSEKFIYLFGKAVPKLSLLLSMILRYIPMLKRQIKKVNNAQKAMGLYTSDSYFDKLKKGINVFSSLVTWSLENSIETSMSMKARGYGLKGRTSYSMFSFKKRDLFLLSSVILLWVVVLLGSFFNQLEFFFYPSISEINKSVFAVLCYISYGILVILPFINELKENIKWKYYVSRI